jgi:calcineurin-like phosphoesterase family protein
MKYFVTSDLHFSHANIIKYCKRPFQNINEMNFTMIKNWNEVVSYNDTIFVLGDFMFSRNLIDIENVVSQLNGNKILIMGNHDTFSIDDYKNIGFNEVYEHMLEIRIHNSLWIMNHYQMALWNKSHKGSFHLFGHEHWNGQYELKHSLYTQLFFSERKYNVCADANNFKPIDLFYIKKKLENKSINSGF